MKHKKLIYIILVSVLSIFLIIPLLLHIVFPHTGIGIDPFSNCGIYDEEDELHSTCICLGIRTRVDNYSRCWGYRVDYYE